MKYIIDLPEEFAEATQEYWEKTVGMQLEPYVEFDRKVIEDEVWKFLAFLIDEIDPDEKYEYFGMSSAYQIVSNMSYQEAKVKYEEWLNQQKNKIHVGDEVVDKDGYKGIVTYVKCALCDVLWDGGSVTEDINKKDFSKTGRHFDEVERLLKKIKGAE